MAEVFKNSGVLLHAVACGLILERGKVSTFTPAPVAPQGRSGTINECTMKEGKRQKQIGGLIQEEINHIFQRLGLSFVGGGLVSVSSVKITPDLLEARIYLSVYNAADKKEVLRKIEDRQWEVKKELAAQVKHQLRRIPELRFYLDDTLDHVFKMEALFDKIKAEGPQEPGTEENNAQPQTPNPEP